MPAGWRKFQAYTAITGNQWTRDLRHVDAVFPRFWSHRVSFRQPKFTAVRPQDRIKWWNIVPGDQVRVLGSKEDTLREVFRINKLSNRVLLKKEQVSTNHYLGPKYLTDLFSSGLSVSEHGQCGEGPQGGIGLYPLF